MTFQSLKYFAFHIITKKMATKKDYKISDKVNITKMGMFYGLIGSILTNNSDTGFKPLSVMLDNNLGVWQMNYEDVEPIGKQKSVKVDHKITEPEAGNKVENLTVATKTEKRSYKKRGVVKEVKVKRSYNRKVKS